MLKKQRALRQILPCEPETMSRWLVIYLCFGLLLFFFARSLWFTDTLVYSSSIFSIGISSSEGRVKAGVSGGDLGQKGYTREKKDSFSSEGVFRINVTSRKEIYPVLHSIEIGWIYFILFFLFGVFASRKQK